MKKFNWKALLIVVLAIVMVFALVACNPTDKDNDKDKDKDKDPETSAEIEKTQQVFTKLWDLTKDIGNETIAATKDVYINADLAVTIGERDLFNKSDSHSFELGIKLEGILDRSTNNSAHTALKIGLYSGSKSIADIFFAIAEPSKIYIDFDGQKVLLPLEVNYDENINNEALGPWIVGALADEIEDLGGKTVGTILKGFTDAMGGEWNLDKFINALLPLFGMEPQDIVDMVAGFVPSLAKEMTDEDDNLSIGKALSSETLAGFFKSTITGSSYTTSLNSDLIEGFILDPLGMSSDNGDDISLEIAFEEQGGKLKDGVTVTADLYSGLYEEKMMSNSDGSGYLTPFVKLHIKDLEFGDGTSKTIAPKNAKADYTTNVALEAKEKLSFEGVKLNGEALKDIEITAKASLDLEGTEAATNKTQAGIALKYDNKPILQASFVKGRLAVTIDNIVTVATYPVINLVVENFGDQLFNWVKDTFFYETKDEEGNVLTYKDLTPLNEFANAFFEGGAAGDHKEIKAGFKGALWTGISPKGVYDNAVKSIVDSIKEAQKKEEDKKPSTEEEDKKFKGNISGIIFNGLSAVKSLGEGKIELHSDDTLSLICAVIGQANGNTKDWNANNKAKAYEEIKKFVLKTYKDATKSTKNDAELETEISGYIEDALTDGTNGVKLEITGAAAKAAGDNYLDYAIKTLLSGLKADIALDLTSGLDWTIVAQFAGAKITYTSEIGLTTPGTQADLAASITSDSEGWVVFDMSSAF